jgi:hypothetical protein
MSSRLWNLYGVRMHRDRAIYKARYLSMQDYHGEYCVHWWECQNPRSGADTATKKDGSTKGGYQLLQNEGWCKCNGWIVARR